jgi:hypothetical protein
MQMRSIVLNSELLLVSNGTNVALLKQTVSTKDFSNGVESSIF